VSSDLIELQVHGQGAPQDSGVADTVLMVRPASFGANPETAQNNIYQASPDGMPAADIRSRAVEEFDELVRRLRAAGVNVVVIEEPDASGSTDSVFPNNWLSTHRDGTVVTYPLWASTRRSERREEYIRDLTSQDWVVSRRIDYAPMETEGRFLEGTGSMVLDRVNRTAFACRSPRTDPEALRIFCRDLGYTPLLFSASQAGPEGDLVDVYHSNVMMSVGENVAIIASDTIRDPEERELVMSTLSATGRCVVTISEEQCRRFAGNMLQVRGSGGRLVLVMSEQAYDSLTPEQIETLKQHTELLHSPLYTVEKYGGGSARCMMAEVFLPRSPNALDPVDSGSTSSRSAPEIIEQTDEPAA